MEKYEEAQPAYNWSHKKVGSRGDEEDKGWKFPHLMNTLKLQIQKEQQISSGRNTRKNQPKSYPNQTAEALGVSWWSGGLVGVRTWCFHHCGPGSNPWSRSHIKPLHSTAKKRRGGAGETDCRHFTGKSYMMWHVLFADKMFNLSPSKESAAKEHRH